MCEGRESFGVGGMRIAFIFIALVLIYIAALSLVKVFEVARKTKELHRTIESDERELERAKRNLANQEREIRDSRIH